MNKLGDLRLRRGEADAALSAYEESLTIRRALAAAEPENTGLQHDVSVSLNKLGDLRLRRGEADAALSAYEEMPDDSRRALAAAEPENTGLQRDVSVELEQAGGSAAAPGRGRRRPLSL